MVLGFYRDMKFLAASNFDLGGCLTFVLLRLFDLFKFEARTMIKSISAIYDISTIVSFSKVKAKTLSNDKTKGQG